MDPRTKQESLSGLFTEVEASSKCGFRMQDSIKEIDQETMLRVVELIELWETLDDRAMSLPQDKKRNLYFVGGPNCEVEVLQAC